MSKHILKKLLCHEVELIHNEYDAFHNPTPQSTILKYVRVEPIKKMTKTTDGEENTSTAILFWDVKYSTKADFLTGDKIVFDGQEYTIRAIKKYFNTTKLHHIELELS